MSDRLSRDAIGVAVALVLLASVAAMAGIYWASLAISILLAVALTQSWAVLSALSGYVSLGHVLFYGIGAYVVVVCWGELPWLVSLPLAGAVAVVFACLIGLPVLRVRGPYFVILTFGVAELAKFIIVAIEAKLGHASRMLLGAPDLLPLLAVMLVLALAATAIAWLVRRSRLGDGLRAIRENEVAAETVGVPVVRYKLIAFAVSAFIPGVAGGVMALRSTYFEPIQAFDPMVSFTMVAMAIIGGSDDLRGPVVGALALTLLSELLWARTPQLYMILLGVLLIAFVLFIPEGICGRLARGRR